MIQEDADMNEAAKIEKVARALCAVDRLDPDEHVQLGGTDVYRQGDMVLAGPAVGPRWKLMARDAARFIACFEALQRTPAEQAAFDDEVVLSKLNLTVPEEHRKR